MENLTLACFTKLSHETTIEPLRGFPIIQDLIIDRSPDSANLLEVEPFIEPKSSEAHEGSSPSYDRDSHLLSDCIECLCCQAACPVVNDEPWELFRGWFLGGSMPLIRGTRVTPRVSLLRKGSIIVTSATRAKNRVRSTSR